MTPPGTLAAAPASSVRISRRLISTSLERQPTPVPDSKSRQPAHLEIRAKSSAELDLALAWATEEGWNPGLADAECFHVADPDGFLMAFRDGEPVASISVVRYDE